MANVARINGFWPKFHLFGAHIQTRRYFVSSAESVAIYPGDPVTLSGTADTDGTNASAKIGVAGAAIIGICVGVAPDLDNLNTSNNYRVGATNRYILVVDDPGVIFEASISNGSFVITDVGLNCDFAIGTPNAASARSGAYADAGTEAGGATLPLKFLGFSSRVDNEVAADAKGLFKLNNHVYNSGTGTAGI